MENLIAVTQLPIIEEQLKKLGAEIDADLSEALSLVCTEETVKAVKAVRASFNKKFQELEEQRKAAKKAVLAPYEAFEAVYKEYVSSKYTAADSKLKAKIDEAENGLKDEKSGELLAYFSEYAQSLHLDWLTFESCGVKVTLSASMGSLREKVGEFIEKVYADSSAINDLEHGDEIMVEYRKCFSLPKAMAIVAERHKAIEQQRKTEEAVAPVVQAEQEAAKKVAAFSPPVEVVRVETVCAKFAAYGTMDQLREMKRYALEIGIKMEAIK